MRNYDYINEKISELMNEKRYKHCLGVVKEAIKLGEIYGSDVNKCKIAAIAHDCAKALNDTELLQKSNEYCIEIDEIQRNFPQLLHGPVGAEYCRREFGIEDEDILNAIYYHTTGRENMSQLEKIIYLADVIEPGRYFLGIEKIREEAMFNLDKSLLLSCNSTLAYVIQKNSLVHPLTIQFRNSLLLKGGE